ncbi:MAG TPA: hypothetical protein VMM12_10435 [Longimicrobiales bacterium]|nr:hypothetical protein [Longimicrobiales bacterium]
MGPGGPRSGSGRTNSCTPSRISYELKAILGAKLREMRQEGRLRALLERAQPVYHLTVSTEYPAAGLGRAGE